MNRPFPEVPERVLDLLADQASVGLEPSEHAELDAAMAAEPVLADESVELAAAALMLACVGPAPEPMPRRVRAKAELAGRKWAAARPSATFTPPELRLAGRSPPNGAALHHAARRPRRSLSGFGAAGWAAAAACLALAAWSWSGGPAGGSPGSARAGLADPGAALAAFRRTGEVVTAAWSHAPDADPSGAACKGEVVWCRSRREGYIVLSGLVPNDSRREQYQLWIFDRERDDKFPVNGGVFDVPADAREVIVKIAPGLPVHHPHKFVITVEKPGGVWVSDRARIPVAASLDG